MPATGAQQTVSFILDTRIAIEALILNRWTKTPAKRRQDWLRGLTISGFRLDCQVLKAAESQTHETHPTAGAINRGYSSWLSTRGADSRTQEIKRDPCQEQNTRKAPLPTQSAAHSNDKPFAALSRVVG